MAQPSLPEWDLEIKPKARLLDVNFKELWRYRDLIALFVRRDVVSAYKQTILGPLWFVLQPLFSTFIFTIIFSSIAKISTSGVPPVLFYLSGMVCWNLFSSSLLKSSSSLVSNSGIFGKVYFPRLAVPLSGVISNLVTFGAQLGLFLVFYIGYMILVPGNTNPGISLLAVPFILLLMLLLSLGLGLVVSSLTTRFRDLQFFLGFGIQLMMYASPVIYPLSSVPTKYKWIIEMNPLTPCLELFRAAFFGLPLPDIGLLVYAVGFTVVVLVVGILSFNQVERTFMDTV